MRGHLPTIGLAAGDVVVMVVCRLSSIWHYTPFQHLHSLIEKGASSGSSKVCVEAFLLLFINVGTTNASRWRGLNFYIARTTTGA